MNRIEVKILNPESVIEAKRMMVCAARLTQKGHQVKNMADFMELYDKLYTSETVRRMTQLPHPTIQKFAVINVAVVGASRRFLAQVTRHQNEVKFMSASLQYSDYSGNAAFAVPYEVIARGLKEVGYYLASCQVGMEQYESAIRQGVDNDAAGYLMPQALRNALIISATPFQWKHMISQRVCRRNTSETRIVFLEIWNELFGLDPYFFSLDTTGPFCMKGDCAEGRMVCGKPMEHLSPFGILRQDYPLIFQEVHDEN